MSLGHKLTYKFPITVHEKGTCNTIRCSGDYLPGTSAGTAVPQWQWHGHGRTMECQRQGQEPAETGGGIMNQCDENSFFDMILAHINDRFPERMSDGENLFLYSHLHSIQACF